VQLKDRETDVLEGLSRYPAALTARQEPAPRPANRKNPILPLQKHDCARLVLPRAFPVRLPRRLILTSRQRVVVGFGVAPVERTWEKAYGHSLTGYL
jgi:hypothetical protein